MNIHELIKTGLLLASDEGADIIVVLEHESGDLVAHTGKEGDYEETDRGDVDEQIDDIEDYIETAQGFLDELVNVGGENDAIDGVAEEV